MPFTPSRSRARLTSQCERDASPAPAAVVRSCLSRDPGISRLALLFLVFTLLSSLDGLGSAADTPAYSSTADPAEADYLVSFWRRSNGLPHDTVNALLQTREGYLWVGTAGGLARFDGLSFTIPRDELPDELEDTVVTVLLEDREGGLWVGTQGKGLLRLLDGKAELLKDDPVVAGNSITCLAEDAQGVVWVGTQAGLKHWARGELVRFASPAVSQGDGIVALHAGGSGTLWVTTRSGVFRVRDGQATAFKSDQLPQGRNAEFIGAYEDRSGSLWAFGATFLLNVTRGQSLNSFPSFNVASSRVWSICEQNNGDFWIGTSGQGLFRFQNGRFEVVGAREGLEHCDIRSLLADRWGNLWIGTGGNGLARLRTRRVKVVGANEGVTSRNVTAIAPDGAGGLWVGTGDAGLWRWNGQRAEPWSAGGPLARVTQVPTLCRDSRSNLWVGTLGAGLIKVSRDGQLQLATADGLADDAILALTESPGSGVLWAGTLGGILHRISGEQIDTFTAAHGLPGSPVRCLLPDSDETLLIGCDSGGLIRLDGTNFSRVYAPPELSTKSIRCLFKDRRGRLWVGTWGAGVFCHLSEGWSQITRRQGLDSDNVGAITQSDNGMFWFSTAENLYRSRVADLEAFFSGNRSSIPFLPAIASSSEGLKCAGGWPTTVRSQNDALWLACSAELLPLTQTESPGFEPVPPVILERILVDNKRQPLPRNGILRLGPGTRSLDFYFTSISFNLPQKVKFHHKLENFDSDWVQSDSRNAHYGPLPPGNYRFRVIAANAEGLWNEKGISLNLVVVPPVWRAWWFLTLSGTILVTGIWATARSISTRRLQARLRAAEQRHAMERERARIARDMHDEIGSKLTRISFLSEIARRAGGKSAVGDFPAPVEAIASTSRELLQSLDEIVWAVNPRNDNLEQLVGYLEQHAREYFQGTACECRIQVPPVLPAAQLSAELRHNVFLAFEEALNNSLKHSGARILNVTMLLKPKEFEVCIQDDGRGFKSGTAQVPEKDGLRNMRERLGSVGGSCEITALPGSGTTVFLRFPLTNRLQKGKLSR